MAQISDSIIRGIMNTDFGLQNLMEPLGMLMGGAKAEREKAIRTSGMLKQAAAAPDFKSLIEIAAQEKDPAILEQLFSAGAYGAQARGAEADRIYKTGEQQATTEERQRAARERSLEESRMKGLRGELLRMFGGQPDKVRLIQSASPEQLDEMVGTLLGTKPVDPAKVHSVSQTYMDSEGNMYNQQFFTDGSYRLVPVGDAPKDPVGGVEPIVEGGVGSDLPGRKALIRLETDWAKDRPKILGDAQKAVAMAAKIKDLKDFLKSNKANYAGKPEEAWLEIKKFLGIKTGTAADLENRFGDLVYQAVGPALDSQYSKQEFEGFARTFPSIGRNVDDNISILNQMYNATLTKAQSLHGYASNQTYLGAQDWVKNRIAATSQPSNSVVPAARLQFK